MILIIIFIFIFAIFFCKQIFLFWILIYFILLLLRWRFLNIFRKVFSFNFRRNRVSSFDKFIIFIIIKFYIVPHFWICPYSFSLLIKFLRSLWRHVIRKSSYIKCVCTKWFLLDIIIFVDFLSYCFLSFILLFHIWIQLIIA